ncbi:hypothetical protein NUACC26_081470 [Scytonema sp. NUACC26]
MSGVLSEMSDFQAKKTDRKEANSGKFRAQILFRLETR